MSEDGYSVNRGQLRAVAMFALIIGVAGYFNSFDLSSGKIIHGPSSVTSLGIWLNMPSASTELLGNTSYRAAFSGGQGGGTYTSGLKALLSVNCLIPSNTAGANLQLQAADYDLVSGSIGSFSNVGGTVVIDNSANSACPGPLTGGDGALTAAANQHGYLFRVLGAGGGGTGDNPRFASINVIIEESYNRFASVVVSTRSTTAFTAFVYVPYQLTSSTTENFDWIATNSSSTVGSPLLQIEHGANSCSIASGGVSCSVSTTFTTAFIGTPMLFARLGMPPLRSP